MKYLKVNESKDKSNWDFGTDKESKMHLCILMFDDGDDHLTSSKT